MILPGSARQGSVLIKVIESMSILLLKQVAASFQLARTWHLDHHPSAAFEQVAGFAFEVLFEKRQRALGVIIQQDTHQLYDIFIFEDGLEGLFHGNAVWIVNLLYAVSNAFASQVVTSAGVGMRPVETTFSLMTKPGVERML